MTVQRSVEVWISAALIGRPPAREICDMSRKPETNLYVGADSPRNASRQAVTWHVTGVDGALSAQDVDPEVGLTDSQVLARRSQFGRNELATAEAEPKWRAFLRQYRDPMQIVLVVSGGVCLLIPGQLAAGILLLALTLFNA